MARLSFRQRPGSPSAGCIGVALLAPGPKPTYPDDGDPDRNLLLSVVWSRAEVEFRSEMRTYVVDVSKVNQKEIWWGQRALRKMARGGVADVRGA